MPICDAWPAVGDLWAHRQLSMIGVVMGTEGLTKYVRIVVDDLGPIVGYQPLFCQEWRLVMRPGVRVYRGGVLL